MVRTILGIGLGLFFLSTASAVSAREMPHTIRSTPAFDQLKSLVGQWQGKDSTGTLVKVVYAVVSNGSVVMERLEPANEHEMITMYSLDGDRILVTHYCAAGNQPTMETAPSTAAKGKYDFLFVRVTGTKTADEGHMASLSLNIPDKDHLTQVWTFDDHGKSHVNTFNYKRAN